MKKIILLAICFLLMLQAPVLAEIYKWVDENGKTHFTDNMGRIPAEYRDQNKPMQEVIDPGKIHELENAYFKGSNLEAYIETKILYKNEKHWKYSWQLHVTNKNNSAMVFSPNINFVDVYGKKINSPYPYRLIIGSRKKKTFKGFGQIKTNLAEVMDRVELQINNSKKTDRTYPISKVRILSVSFLGDKSKKFPGRKCCVWKFELENQGKESAIFSLGIKYYTNDDFLIAEQVVERDLYLNPLESKTHHARHTYYSPLGVIKHERGKFRVEAYYEAYIVGYRNKTSISLSAPF